MIDSTKFQEACRNYQKTLRSKYEPFQAYIDNNNKSDGRNAYVVDTRTGEEIVATYVDRVCSDVETANIVFQHCMLTFEEREAWLTGNV